MEYKKIWYFLQVARNMNIKRTAMELYISPQALSKQIISLEDEIGKPLFIRSNAGISLTETGRQLQQSFEGLFQNLDRVWDVFLSDIQKQESTIHIAFYRSLPQIAVVSFVMEFLIEHNPELKLELTGCEISDVLSMLRDGKCDIAITNIHEGSEGEDLSILKLARLPAQILVSRNHPWCNNSGSVSVEALAREAIVIYKSASAQGDNFHRMLQGKTGKKVRTITAGDEDAIMQQVVLGNGYVVRPAYTAKNYIDKLSILNLPDELQFHIDVVIAFRKNHPLADEFEKMRNIRVVL